MSPSDDFRKFVHGRKFGTVLADPPWRFLNRTGKVAPEHRRLSRYDTMTVDEICELPVRDALADRAHLYLWVPNALLPDGLRVRQAGGQPLVYRQAHVRELRLRQPVAGGLGGVLGRAARADGRALTALIA